MAPASTPSIASIPEMSCFAVDSGSSSASPGSTGSGTIVAIAIAASLLLTIIGAFLKLIHRTTNESQSDEPPQSQYDNSATTAPDCPSTSLTSPPPAHVRESPRALPDASSIFLQTGGSLSPFEWSFSLGMTM